MPETIERPTFTFGGQTGIRIPLGRLMDFGFFARPGQLNNNQIDQIRAELGFFENATATPTIRINGSPDGIAIDFGFRRAIVPSIGGSLLSTNTGLFTGLRVLALEDGTPRRTGFVTPSACFVRCNI